MQDGKSVDPDSPASILVLDGMMKQHAEQRHHQLSHLLFLVTAWIDVSHREQPVLPYRHLKHGPDIQQYAQDSCTTLHWLDVPKCIQYKIGVTVHRCLHSKAPKYRPDCCIPVSDIASQRIYSWPVNITSLYLVTSSVSSVAKPSLLQTRWSGTLY